MSGYKLLFSPRCGCSTWYSATSQHFIFLYPTPLMNVTPLHCDCMVISNRARELSVKMRVDCWLVEQIMRCLWWAQHGVKHQWCRVDQTQQVLGGWRSLSRRNKNEAHSPFLSFTAIMLYKAMANTELADAEPLSQRGNTSFLRLLFATRCIILFCVLLFKDT